MAADSRAARQQRFAAVYAGPKRPPWDSGRVPPEVRALVEGEAPLPPGRALDVGCGTGISAVYLATHGWQVLGVDWVAAAVERARRRAQAAGVTGARFRQADVEAADFLADEAPVSLWLDVGCLHGLAAASRPRYAAHAARLVAAGGLLRLYAFCQHERDGEIRGIDPDAIEALFAPAFRIEEIAIGQDTAGETRPSAWYALRRASR